MHSSPRPLRPPSALDFLRLEPPPAYPRAVRALSSLLLPCEDYRRPTARPRRPFSASDGDKLVKPVEERLVPTDDMAQHLSISSRLPPPSRDYAASADPAACAAAFAAVAHREHLTEWRTERGVQVRAIAQSLEQHGAFIASLASGTVAPLVAGMNLAFLAAYIDARRWPDRTIVQRFVEGFVTVGDIEDSGLFRPVYDPAEFSTSAFTPAANAQWMSDVVRTVSAARDDPSKAAEVESLYATTLKEVAEGHAVGPYSRRGICALFGSRLRPQVRFGKPEASKVRAIDNMKGMLGNAASSTRETIVCITVEFSAIAAALVLAACYYFGIAMLAMLIGLEDMKAAYRRIPGAQPWYHVIAVLNPATGLVEFFYIPGHTFGAKSAVLNFNRFPKIMVDMARLLFAVICDQYFDDYMILDILVGADSAQTALGLCHDLVGQSLEPKKSQPMATGNKGLGNLIFMGNVHAEYAVWIMTTTDRREKVLAMLDAARCARHLTPADASTIRGKIGFLLTAAWGKVGRAATQPLLQREYYDTDYSFSPALDAMCEFFEALLPDLPALCIPIVPDPRPPVVLYTDAMFRRMAGDPAVLHRDPRGVPVSRIGIVVRDSMTGIDRHSDHALPQWVFDYLSPTDKTLVMQAEMIAPIAALLSRPDDFAGRSVVLFIDNVGALSSLLHGYSSKPDCARLCNVFHLLAASLRCSFWFEWVPSGANISDLPSRLYYERYLQLLPRSRWFSCTLPDASTWDAPLRAVLRSFRALAPAL